MMGQVLQTTYQPYLVALSVLIATMASYVALDVGTRIATKRHGNKRWAMMGGAAFALGGGIWSMHFIGMIAMQIPVPVSYDIPFLLGSVFFATLASSVGILVANREKSGQWQMVVASLFIGAAIFGMHYIGMAGVRGPFYIRYNQVYVVASIVISIVASYVAMQLTAQASRQGSRFPNRLRVGGAVAMGLAVTIMHYTGMHAAIFCAGPITFATFGTLATPGLALTISAIALVVFGLNLAATHVDRQVEEREKAEALARERAELLEREQVARREVEKANRVKLDFLATMSHELRTPLNAIAGYAELLEIGVHGPVNAAQLEAIGRIQRSEKRLLGLINDVLNFAKIDAGSVKYTLRDVPVHSVIAESVALLEAEMKSRGLRYEIVPLDRHMLVRADDEKVGQILINLIGNAVKFTDPGGCITLSCSATGEYVSITVADTGIGIPDDKLDGVFEPFVQVSSGLTRERQGTGLGLAISRDLALGMHGDLTVASEVGIGSRFVLTLPRAFSLRTAIATDTLSSGRVRAPEFEHDIAGGDVGAERIENGAGAGMSARPAMATVLNSVQRHR